MKVKHVILTAFLSALALGGIYAGIAVKRLMNICYNIVKYEAKIDIQYIYLKLTLQLKNPSAFKIGIEGYSLDVMLNNKKVAQVVDKMHQEILAEGVSMIQIRVKVEYLKTLDATWGKELFNAFTQKRYSDIFISLKGTFNGSALKIAAHVPVDYKITLQEIIKIMDEPASAPC